MLRELLAAVVFTATLAGIWELGTLQTTLSRVVDTPIQRKMNAADRVVHYRFDENTGPAFHLDGDEIELRLVTHLFLGEGRTYSPDQTYDYGLRLRIEDPSGRTFWERDVYTSTRQSKDRWVEGHWMQENAFSLEPDIEITDDRVHLITLPRDVPRGSRFYTNLEAPAAAFGVMRVYERSTDTSLGLSLTYFGPTPQDEQRLVGRLTYLPWEALSSDQRLARLRPRWARLSALGEVGKNYAVETIFYAGFRAPQVELPVPPPPTLVDDRATAITAWGPGELRLWVHSDCPPRAEDSPRPWVELLHLDAMGVVDGQYVDPCEGAVYEVWLPEGPHTVHVLGEDLPDTDVEAWFDAERDDPQTAPGFELGTPFRPTITRSPRIRLHSGGAPADYALIEPADLEAAIIQLRAQLPVNPREGPEAQRPATVRYSFIDRHGQPLEQGEWPIDPAPQLERYEWVVDAADAAREWWVSPPLTTRFIVPEGTRRLRLESVGDVIVSVYTYWPGSKERRRPHPPYDDVMLVGTKWRRIPIDYDRWFRIEPDNAHVLARRSQTVDLHGPIRLELLGEGEDLRGRNDDEPSEDPPTSTTPWVSLAPYTRHETRTVLERTTADSPWARYARWQPGSATLAVDDDWGATLVYLVEGAPEASLGQTITVTIDGTMLEHTISSTRGTWKLPGLGPGTHALELGSLPEGMQVYVDRPRLAPHKGQADVYHVITMYRLDRRRMGLKVAKQRLGREYINAIMMRCDDFDEGRLHVVLDDGAPERKRGVPIERLTRATRERVLPARGTPTDVVFFDRPSATCEAIGRVPIPMGPDLAGDTHRIDLRTSTGPGLWVRFFRRGTAQSQPEPAGEWTERLLDLEPGAP